MTSSFLQIARHLRFGALAALVLAFTGCSTVPEVGMLFDRNPKDHSIIVRLKQQKAYLYRDGNVVAVSTVSTGREGYNTPAGKYRVVQKDIDHRSTIYGAYVKNGRVVKANVNVKKDRKPAGAIFIGAPMPYFLRINGAVGLHAGHVPGYPASHGCIRLPPRQARRFYYAVEVGTPVFIYR
jgi:lipoprotein-anchoring transpeptidase ErfK/SrfK